VFALEGRALQAALAPATASIAIPAADLPQTSTVDFQTPGTSASNVSTQQVSQQSAAATVVLERSNLTSALQVQVTTDPSSPYVGVNVGAVNQTVTFAADQTEAELTVPIIAGAPNPGEVDVNLTITPINPPSGVSVTGPLELRVMASDASIPPMLVAEDGAPQGIELIFNKPMDPVQASNVKNYAVHEVVKHEHGGNDPLGLLFPLPASITSTPTLVPLKSAQYNSATNTVTLIPRRHFTYASQIIVTQGNPAHAAGGANAGAGAALGIVDMEGDPIDQTTTPGKFSVLVSRGFTAVPSGPSGFSGLIKRELHAHTDHYHLGI
jgi:hypothetical protein